MMKTKYHLSIFLIALFAGLMGFTTDAAAKDKKPPSRPWIELTPGPDYNPSITVKWKRCSDNKTAPEDLRYRIYWRICEEGSEWQCNAWYLMDAPKDITEYTITGLKADVEYFVYVVVTDEAGNNALSTTYHEWSMVPHSPGKPFYWISTKNTISITFEYPFAHNGVYYKVLWRKKSSKSFNETRVMYYSHFDDDRVSYTINDLDPGTEYVVDVVICDKDGTPKKDLKSWGEQTIKTQGQPLPEPNLPNELTLEPKELTVDAIQNYQEVTLSYSTAYHVNDINNPNWLSLSRNSPGYEKSQKLLIAIMQNPGPERTGTITFKTSAGNVTLKVTQRAASSTPSANLTLEPKELTVEAKGGEHKVKITSTQTIGPMDFVVPDWIIRYSYPPGSYTSKVVDLTFKPNTGAERTGEITIKTTAGNVKLKVTQKAASSTPSAKLTLEPKELTVEANRSYPKLKISCDEEFLFQGVSGLDWVSLNGNTPDYKKSHTFGLIVEENTGAERTGEITIKTTAGNVKLKVTQRAASSTPSAKLTLEPNALTMKYHRNEAEVTLACSDKAFSINQVVIDQLDWLSATGGSGLYKKHFIRITAQENTGAERTGTVTFKTTEGEVTLNVTQEAKSTAPPTLTLTPTTLTFAASGGASQSVAVKSSVEGWGVRLKDRTQDWLTVTPDAAAKTVTVAVKPNTGTKKRSAEVEVVSDAGLTRSFFVTQQGNRPPEAVSGLSLNPEAMTMGGSSGAVGFTLKSDKPWTVTADADWLHPGSTRGNAGTTYFRLRFDQNTTGAVRTGKATFTTTDGKATKTFTLTQRVGSAKPKPSTPSEGTYDYDLAVNPESITLSGEGGGSSIDVVTHRLWAGSTADDWITLEKAVGSGDGSFDFTLAPNPSKEMRHGKITVRTEHGMDELTIAIHQQGQTGDIVLPGAVKVSGLTLDPATLVVDGDIATTLISALVSPENAANKSLLWMSSNPAVATVSVLGQKRSGVAYLPQLRFAPDADDYALVTIAGKGKATITAATSDGSGIVARCEIEVRSTVGNVVPYAPAAKIYATPGTLHLTLPQATRVEIYTLLGIRLRTLDAPAGDTSVTLPRGLYIVRAGSAVQKVRIE